MNSKGNFNSEKDCIAFMGGIDMLFPLPSGNIMCGQKERKELKFPIKRSGVLGYALGYNEIEYVQDDEPGMAILRCQIGVDSLAFRDKVRGKQTVKLLGKGEYIFNYQDGCFVSAQLEYKKYAIATFISAGEKMANKTGENTTIKIDFLGIE